MESTWNYSIEALSIVRKMFDQSSLKILNVLQIQEFQEQGVIVIPSVLTSDEVEKARLSLHRSLLAAGCDHNDLHDTASALRDLSSTGGSGSFFPFTLHFLISSY